MNDYPSLVPKPNTAQQIRAAKARIVILQAAQDRLRGSKLLAEDGIDMLIRDEGLKLSKLARGQVRAARHEGATP